MFNFLKKNWSDQNLTSWTGSYADVVEDDGDISGLDDVYVVEDDGDTSGLDDVHVVEDDEDTPSLDGAHLVILVNPTQ